MNVLAVKGCGTEWWVFRSTWLLGTRLNSVYGLVIAGWVSSTADENCGKRVYNSDYLLLCWFQFTAEVLEALVNMADVFAELWPTDSTPRILLRILVHYNFGSGVKSNEGEKCKVVSEFCDNVLRENALRALAKDPPLSYRQAKERWVDVTEQYTSSLFGFRDNRQDSRQTGGGRGNGGPSSSNSNSGGGFGRGAAQ
jgi:uncharacterized membrane protein YgcG